MIVNSLKQDKLKNFLMKILFLPLISFLIALVFPGFQTILNAQGSSSLLDTVVVTSSRDEQSYREVPQPITVITQEEIQEKHAADVADLLRQKGFQYNPLGANTGLVRVAIRGFSTSTSPNDTGDVLILLDGRYIGNNNIGMISLQNIERIEVLHGPGAVQYGTSALGGVINLISRRGADKPTVFVEQTVGSFGHNKTQAGFSGKYKGFDFSAGGSYLHAGNYKVGKGTLYGLPNTAANIIPGDRIYLGSNVSYQKTLGANFGYNFSDNHRFGIVLSNYISFQGRPGAMTRTSSGSVEAKGIRKAHSIDFLYTGSAPSYGLSWTARYFQGLTRYVTATYWNRFPKGGYYDYATIFKGFQASLGWDWENVHLTLGFDQYHEEYEQFSYTGATTDFTYRDRAIYLLGRVGLLDENLWISGGVRYDMYDIGGPPDVPVPTKKRATPALGIAYLPVDWLKLRINYAQSFAVPKTDDLFNDSVSSSGIHYVPNPDLKAQYAVNWDFGIDVSYEAFTGSLTYFLVNYTDLIRTKTIQTEPERYDQFQNLDGVSKYRGLELSLDWEMGQTFGWNFDIKPYITLTKLFESVDPTGALLTTTADLSMAYGISFAYPDYGLTASLDANYYGEQLPSWGSTTWAGIRFGRDHIYDFHLSKDLYTWDTAGKVKLKVDVLNLANKFYQLSAGYPQPGRQIFVSVRYEY
ncbi:MAG: TonB-dependent receptor [Deltaproteobacteria bacterium]|jgi:vitamin B12 transporter|nr:TonB-dependent receptor [Deltaproteobacteria bacterium]